MKFNEYQELSKRTMPALKEGKYEFYYSRMDKCNYAMGLTGEAGEVSDLLKKWIHHKHTENKEELIKECGDVLHYLAGICTMYGIRLEEVATMNLLKLKERYPNGFSVEDSMNRREYQESESVKQAKGKLTALFGRKVYHGGK